MHTGFITTEELGDLLLFLGKRYSESVLKDIITKADVDLNRGVDFTQFLKIMGNKVCIFFSLLISWCMTVY
jgi:Ca2+-binding EF-hand superfamily protein